MNGEWKSWGSWKGSVKETLKASSEMVPEFESD